MSRAFPLDWPAIRGPRITPSHIFYAAIAALPILALMSTTPASWWVQSGFETYPGTFVAYTTDNYPLCRPWRDRNPGDHREKGVHVTARFGSVVGPQQTNLAVLLPKTAHVTAVYCGAAENAAPLSDCSVLRCPVAAHFDVEDGIYTRGRGLEFSVRRPKATPPDARTQAGFWVFWRDA